MRIEWNDELSTGVQEIDNQHRELIRQLNVLRDACREGRGKEVIDDLIIFLGRYIDEHIDTEEKYMNKYNYPQKNFHISQHRELTERFKKLKEDFLRSGLRLVATLEANELLGMWWIDHIFKVDKALGRYLREKIKSEDG